MLDLIMTTDYLFCYLKKLQAKNALEWEKREHVESEKLALERETKRLRSVIEVSRFDNDN